MFEEGQIWALCRSKNVNLTCYAQVKKIESIMLRLHVDILELYGDAVKPNNYGIYKASTDGRQIFNQDSSLYRVKAEVSGRNTFDIYSRNSKPIRPHGSTGPE
jgi:hypothetical protein